MRIPRKLPDIDRLLVEALTSKDTNKQHIIFGKLIGPLYKDKYLHWDELKYRPDFEGLSAEEYWLATKLSRRNFYREVPLYDKEKNYFQYAFIDLVHKQLHQIDKYAGGALKSDSIEPELRDKFYIKSLYEEAITSSQLEGAATTRIVAKEMLRSGRKPVDKNEQMIYNNYQAMKNIRQMKGDPLTIEIIIELQEILTRNTLDDNDIIGRLRRSDEPYKVYDDGNQVLHDPPSADELPKRLQTLCDFANNESEDSFMHPVIKAIILHFQLAYDHPFGDGNGRTARALFYWAMLKGGYWLCEYISISNILYKAPAQYGRSFLHTETDDTDLTYFLIFNLRVILNSINVLHKEIDRFSKNIREASLRLRQSARLRMLNHRQVFIIEHALRHPHEAYTFKSHRWSNNLSYQTARTDLLALSELGLLDKIKSGKNFVFISPMDLKQRLEMK